MESGSCPKNQDALCTEFVYYSSVLRIVAPSLSIVSDKEVVIPWIRKLFRPEYHSSKFREKRNKYLVYLTISLLNDEAYGIFSDKPPEGALMKLHELQPDQVPAAEWETDKMWQEILLCLPDDFIQYTCSVHNGPDECKMDHGLDNVLDQEFQFMMHIARPYCALIKNGEDRTKVAAWIQALCTVCGPACSSMKAIRNDYMMALLGYLHDLRVVDPFHDYPPWKTLMPLAEAAKNCCEGKTIIDPSRPEANEFLMDQPMPDDGAFCYIALTGDLISSSFG